MSSKMRTYGASNRDSQAEPLIPQSPTVEESDASSVHPTASAKSISAPLRRFSATVRTNLSAMRKRTNSTSSVSSTISTPSKLREISEPMKLGSIAIGHGPIEHLASHTPAGQLDARVPRLMIQSKLFAENRASWRDDGTIDPVTLEAMELAERVARLRAEAEGIEAASAESEEVKVASRR